MEDRAGFKGGYIDALSKEDNDRAKELIHKDRLMKNIRFGGIIVGISLINLIQKEFFEYSDQRV